MTYHHLVTARTVGEERNRAVQRFGEVALAHARAAGDQGIEAVVHNNIANSYLAIGGFEHQALKHLNAARRLRPTYMRSDYFLVDLGRALFGTKRYRAAAVFYRIAYDLQPQRDVRSFLADALMFAGLVGEAATHLRALQDDIGPDEASEVGLKAMLCESMEAEFRSPVVPAGTWAGQVRISQLVGGELEDPAVLRDVTLSFDAFNLSANFDLALHSMKTGDYADAVARFLICAFKRSGDVEAWRNAILMAANLRDALIAAAVVDCAMRMGGTAVRDTVRAELLAQGHDDRVVEAIDLTMTTALDLIGQRDRGVLYRMLEIDSADPMLTFSLS
jgi:tetratricopeptide (TPR) repeat protein